MSSTLSEGVRVPDIGSVNWGADVNFNWGLLNTCLANISDNVKTDVENTWTATQTFSETISGSIDGVAARAVGDEDGTNIKAAIASKAADDQVVHLAGAETVTGDKTFTGNTVTHQLTPETNGTYQLGSTSLRWTSLYASDSVFVHYRGLSFGTPPTTATYFGLRLNDDSGAVYGDVLAKSDPDGHNALRLRCRNTDGTNTYDRQISLIVLQNGITQFIPNASGVFDLGRATLKWKTLNGINPGALSFPSSSTSAYININSSIPDLTGTTGTYVPTVAGWIHLNINPNSSNYAYASATWLVARVSSESTTGRNAMITIPALAGVAVTLSAVGGSIAQARFTPCQGNV